MCTYTEYSISERTVVSSCSCCSQRNKFLDLQVVNFKFGRWISIPRIVSLWIPLQNYPTLLWFIAATIWNWWVYGNYYKTKVYQSNLPIRIDINRKVFICLNLLPICIRLMQYIIISGSNKLWGYLQDISFCLCYCWCCNLYLI